MSYLPSRIAWAVCEVMERDKSRPVTPEAIFAGQRGSPRCAELRALTMFLWRLWIKKTPTYTATGVVFDRDRRNVQRALHRLAQSRIPSRQQISEIKRLLDGEAAQ